MRPLRISAISFLNTAPLMWDFEHGHPPAATASTPASADFEIAYTTPSRCAEELRTGAADIGIIPAVAYASIPELVIVPDVAIAARGPVRSILLVSKRPLQEVSTIATDTSSRTSVALLDVLLRKWLGGARPLTEMEPELDSMLRACDAALLIGDAALRVGSGKGANGQREPYFVYDLAQEWFRRAGKPFVFAFWAVRLAALGEMRRGVDLERIFRESRDHGLEPPNVVQIARQWAAVVGLSEAEIVSYLTRNIHYALDDGCLDGMELFFRYAVECGVIPTAPTLRFLGNLRMALHSGTQ